MVACLCQVESKVLLKVVLSTKVELCQHNTTILVFAAL